ncbi:MAG: ABC transporter permease subunit [Eisenbergiella sp.]
MVNAYGVFLIRQFMVSVPDSYIEAAKLDGAGYLRIYAGIMLRCASAALVTLDVYLCGQLE